MSAVLESAMPGSALKEHPTLAQERVMAVISPANLSRLEWIKANLGAIFPRLDCIAPKDLKHLGEVVRRSRETHRVLIAAGGDGTLHQVLQQLDLEGQILGLLPLGTGNDLARVIGYPAAPAGALAYLLNCVPVPTDIILANGVRVHNSSGFGIDTATLKVRDRSKGLLHTNYNLAFLSALSRMSPLAMRVEFDGEFEEGEYWWVLCMNNRDIGKGTRIAPEAKFDDGLLDMLLIRRMPKLALAAMLPKASRGEHVRNPAVLYRQVRKVRCILREPIDYLACDGEMHFQASREVSFEIQPAALNLLRTPAV